MINNEKNPTKGRQHAFLLLATVVLLLTASGLVGCGQSVEEPEAVDSVDYAPLPGEDWEVSTPAEQELDPQLVAGLYESAADL